MWGQPLERTSLLETQGWEVSPQQSWAWSRDETALTVVSHMSKFLLSPQGTAAVRYTTEGARWGSLAHGLLVQLSCPEACRGKLCYGCQLAIESARGILMRRGMAVCHPAAWEVGLGEQGLADFFVSPVGSQQLCSLAAFWVKEIVPLSRSPVLRLLVEEPVREVLYSTLRAWR